MNDKKSSVHWSFWVIGALALVWNGMGVLNYLMQTNPDALAAMPEAQRAMIESRPSWATWAFAVAVFAGTIGCLLLLLRKSTAYYLFIVSLIGMIVHIASYFGNSGTDGDLGASQMILYAAMPLVVSILLIWYSARANKNGWTT